MEAITTLTAVLICATLNGLSALLFHRRAEKQLERLALLMENLSEQLANGKRVITK